MLGKRHCLLLVLGCAALMMTSQLVAQTIRYEYESFEVPGAVYTRAFHISPQGHVVGRYTTGTNQCTRSAHSFVWKDGAFEYFDVPGAYTTTAEGINALGEVTGRFVNEPGTETDGGCTSNPYRGFIRTKRGEFLEITLPDAIWPGGNQITPSGMVVGDFLDADCWPGGMNSPGCAHGFLLKRGSLYQIDYPGSNSTDVRSISEAGDIVGTYGDSEDRQRGFLLSNGKFSTVDFPGATVTWINDINPAGEMVGYAWNTVQGWDVSFLVRAGEFIEIQFPDAVSTTA